MAKECQMICSCCSAREVWINAYGYDDIYDVSNRGRVLSLARTKLIKGCMHPVTKRILSAYQEKLGYWTVRLSMNGNVKSEYVHRLVLEAFCGLPLSGEQCRHMDGNPSHNCLENLRWGTIREDREDQRRHGTLRTAENLAKSKITDEIAKEMYDLVKSGVSRSAVARRFDVHSSLVSRLVRGEVWVHLGLEPIYSNCDKELRDAAIYHDYVRGIVKQVDLAKKYDVSQATISKAILKNSGA